MKLGLLSLTIGGLSIGMTEFLMMGVLPDISQSLNVTIPEAGHLISIYALGVVIGAPVLVGLAGNYPPKKVLMGLMVFVFNGLFALAPNYGLLLQPVFLRACRTALFLALGRWWPASWQNLEERPGLYRACLPV